MTTSDQVPSAQLGLLDLSVDLSVPEVYSGTDFTVYLHIKNPFALPAWIDSVELSLPTQLLWRPNLPEEPDKQGRERRQERKVIKQILKRDKEIRNLREKLADLGESATSERRRIEDQVSDLEAQNRLSWAKIESQVEIDSRDGTVNLEGFLRNVRVNSMDSTVNIKMRDASERVKLIGSLPDGAALEPGCTDVWTIRLGTNKGPFFIPAKYHLQLTVIYALEPSVAGSEGPTAPAAAGSDQERPRRRIFSNTTSFTVPVKSALRNVMLGGVAGGAVGSAARSLQNAGTLDAMASARLGISVASLLLSVILSWAAIIFSARKSEAQSFVTVEDFWGGLLIGFLIGYSGTAAFTNITGVKA
ncbi:hypothetical protein [Kitasatospora sp. NPDC056531]|uniref:hypothetical protein n=1 Tax=Kitasatospora sp. NPDC056531 TaxID=3345856 RepID=UPI0036B7D914